MESEKLGTAVAEDYTRADLSPADRAMLDFAIKLTHTPWAMRREDVEGLRAVGFGDVAIHDIVQVAALFNYYNRLADGLGIDAEPGLDPVGRLTKLE